MKRLTQEFETPSQMEATTIRWVGCCCTSGHEAREEDDASSAQYIVQRPSKPAAENGASQVWAGVDETDDPRCLRFRHIGRLKPKLFGIVNLCTVDNRFIHPLHHSCHTAHD